MRNYNANPTPNPSPTWEGNIAAVLNHGSSVALPTLVGNCEQGAIGERSDGGAKPGLVVGSVSLVK